MADADAQSLDATILTHDATLLQDTVRDAGALAQSMFRTELKKWTKGASSPVSEADI
ncbi:MAG TPA: 3'(2'),5'-bisphosphate nucleotidase CysQ, partial [Bradyrhizobium sp.]